MTLFEDLENSLDLPEDDVSFDWDAKVAETQALIAEYNSLRAKKTLNRSNFVVIERFFA